MQSSTRYIIKKKKKPQRYSAMLSYAALIFSPCPIDEIVSWRRHELAFVSPPSFCFMYNWAFWKDSKCHLCLSVPRHRVRRGKAKWRYSSDAWIYSKNKETGLFFFPHWSKHCPCHGPACKLMVSLSAQWCHLLLMSKWQLVAMAPAAPLGAKLLFRMISDITLSALRSQKAGQ